MCKSSLVMLLTLTPLLAAGKTRQRPDLPGREDYSRLKRAGISPGGALPSINIHKETGAAFNLANLKKRYHVLVFGCMTCPVFLARVRGFEAIYRDFKKMNVDFYFVYKTLAHPEYGEGFVEAHNINERLKHVKYAKKNLGTTIPWLADNMKNQFSKALGWGPNVELIIDPNGKIVNMRDWANPRLLREKLNELVGKPKHVTNVADVGMPLYTPPSHPERGLVDRLKVPGRLIPLQSNPTGGALPSYAKLRAEAGPKLLKTGTGKLYLGLHLDPIHKVHWNNLAPAVQMSINAPQGVTVKPKNLKFHKVKVKSDIDPREFLVSVDGWKSNQSLEVKVRYYACDANNTWCRMVKQSYQVQNKTRPGSGRVFTRGTTLRKPKAEISLDTFMQNDKNDDGVISRNEVTEEIDIRLFNRIDLDFDGVVSSPEMSAFNAEHRKQLQLRKSQQKRSGQ